MTLKDHGHNPNMSGAHRLENDWRYREEEERGKGEKVKGRRSVPVDKNLRLRDWKRVVIVLCG